MKPRWFERLGSLSWRAIGVIALLDVALWVIVAAAFERSVGRAVVLGLIVSALVPVVGARMHRDFVESDKAVRGRSRRDESDAG